MYRAELIYRINDDTLHCKKNKAEETCGEDAAAWQQLVEKKLTTPLHNLIFKCNTCKFSNSFMETKLYKILHQLRRLMENETQNRVVTGKVIINSLTNMYLPLTSAEGEQIILRPCNATSIFCPKLSYFSCNNWNICSYFSVGDEVPLYAIITTAVIAGMLLIVIIIVCVCCCACLDSKGAKTKVRIISMS